MNNTKRNPADVVDRIFALAEPAGFEPTSAGVKVLCLTAWRRLNISNIIAIIAVNVNNSLAFFDFCGILYVNSPYSSARINREGGLSPPQQPLPYLA